MNRQHGMTLVEALVALVLLSMLSVGIFATFRVGQRTYTQLVSRSAELRSIFLVQRVLRRLVESAYPFQADASRNRFAVNGLKNEIALTAPEPSQLEGGFSRYRVFAIDRSDGLKDLVVQYGVDRNGLFGEVNSVPTQEMLLQKISGIEFAYLPKRNLGSDSDLATPETWLDTWRDQSDLPALIRIRVQFATTDTRRWIDLIAAPRITDNALCEFDVVAQACRDSVR